MEPPPLKLVPEPRSDRHGRVGAALAPILAVVAALAASAAIRAPHPIADDPSAGVDAAFRTVLREGAASERLHADTLGLRTHLGRHPLDGDGRAAYAALLSLRAADEAGSAAAAHHASAAVGTAPVTVPVVRRAAGVLFRAGRTEEALALATGMFAYDPGAAARLLDAFRGVVVEGRIREAIPEDPVAWLAWSRQLRRRGDGAGADAALAAATDRWPEDLGVLGEAAERRVVEDDRDGAIALLRERTFPRGAETARVRALRARALAWDGDPAYAREELEAAFEDAPDDVPVLLHGGDAWLDLGEFDRARSWWNRARFRIPRGNREGRAVFAVRVARMEDARGNGARQLRAWKQVLEVDPGNEVARERVEDLRGDDVLDGRPGGR